MTNDTKKLAQKLRDMSTAEERESELGIHLDGVFAQAIKEDADFKKDKDYFVEKEEDREGLKEVYVIVENDVQQLGAIENSERIAHKEPRTASVFNSLNKYLVRFRELFRSANSRMCAYEKNNHDSLVDQLGLPQLTQITWRENLYPSGDLNRDNLLIDVYDQRVARELHAVRDKPEELVEKIARFMSAKTLEERMGFVPVHTEKGKAVPESYEFMPAHMRIAVASVALTDDELAGVQAKIAEGDKPSKEELAKVLKRSKIELGGYDNWVRRSVLLDAGCYERPFEEFYLKREGMIKNPASKFYLGGEQMREYIVRPNLEGPEAEYAAQPNQALKEKVFEAKIQPARLLIAELAKESIEQSKK